jgi:hypothetical protein
MPDNFARLSGFAMPQGQITSFGSKKTPGTHAVPRRFVELWGVV